MRRTATFSLEDEVLQDLTRVAQRLDTSKSRLVEEGIRYIVDKYRSSIRIIVKEHTDEQADRGSSIRQI